MLLTVLILPLWLCAQQNDPVLFTVEGNPVHVSEFEYIYTKTNGDKADFSRQSLEEYLELYVKFKLKVQKAKELQLDTIPALQRELEGYRRQLADSYLIDREVTDKLLRETYERIQEDVDISHILVSVKPDAAPADTLAAYQKALAAKRRVEKGEDFAKVARETSDDPYADRNDGRIGFVTALLPNGMYHLETLAYDLSPGAVGGPVRTSFGYHVVKAHGRRPARGQIEVGHILIRTDSTNVDAMKVRIDSVYQALQNGADFEELARSVSEDRNTAARGGYIGIFGINQYAKSFEDAAFGLEEDGAVSQPFQTSSGWHVLRRISKKEIQPFEIEKNRLKGRIQRDSRFELAKAAMIDRIKRENEFQENADLLDEYAQTLTDTFLTFRWKAPANPSREVLFSLNGGRQEVTLGAFTDYLGESTRDRIGLGGRNMDPAEALASLYDNFVNQKLLQFEEEQLEKKYPEFKALMREYEEGILLFEVTKMLVWDKASQDTVGLAEFYQKVKSHYRWQERARMTIYYVTEEGSGQLDPIREFAGTHTAEEVLDRFNTDGNVIISAEEKIYEKNRNEYDQQVAWEAGALSQTEPNPRLRRYKFVKVEEILPSDYKTLREARGYVVADYQDYLEKEWVEALRDEYPTTIQEQVLDNMVKE